MRNPTVSVRDVHKEYAKIKALMPGLGNLQRDDSQNWHLGAVKIGSTSREAKALLVGMRLGVQFYGLAGGK